MKNALFPVVILAGGLATRLYPITETLPKSLVNINGEPFINYQLRLLRQRGISQVLLCVGAFGHMLEEHVGDGRRFNVKVSYSYDGDTLLGTGGAIRKALPLLDDSFFILYGDSYLDCDYEAIQTAFLASRKYALMTVFHNVEQWDSSNIEYRDGKIISYEKKRKTSRMHYIDYGIGVLSRSAVLQIPEHENYDLVLLYQALIKQQQLSAYEIDKRYYEVGSFTGIKEFQSYLFAHSEIHIGKIPQA